MGTDETMSCAKKEEAVSLDDCQVVENELLLGTDSSHRSPRFSLSVSRIFDSVDGSLKSSSDTASATQSDEKVSEEESIETVAELRSETFNILVAFTVLLFVGSLVLCIVTLLRDSHNEDQAVPEKEYPYPIVMEVHHGDQAADIFSTSHTYGSNRRRLAP